MVARAIRDADRGQTLPAWTFAVLACLGVMFFTLNYANVLRAQVRAQTVAEMLVQTQVAVQSTRWNKVTMALYAADVEEWRIRTLLQAMMDAARGDGGCTESGTTGGSCLPIYNALQQQYDRAVNRYKNDAYALDAVSYQPSYYFLGNTEADGMRAITEIACQHAPALSSECGQFTYHTIDYGYRSTVQAVSKDAIYAHVGGVTGTAPAVNWQPIQIEVSVCETVKPIVSFSMFGFAPTPVQIVGRAAATMAPVVSEWLAPGVTTNPNDSNGNALFQEPESYSSYDTFGSSTPRDWYRTTFPAQPYTAVSATNYGITNSVLTSDFEVFVPWWGVVPILPYTTTAQTPGLLCTADPSMSN